MTLLFAFILILLLVPFGIIFFVFRDGTRPLEGVTIIPVCRGWAGNTVNTGIFRQSSLTSHDGFQYIAFYDGEGFVLLGKRALGSAQWTVRNTGYRGNPWDAHNGISIGIDGGGIIHMAWDMHDRKLRYCRSREPGSLEMTEELPMTGLHENRVSYPQFYTLSDGSLLFLYRHGESGCGDVMLNRFDLKSRTWSALHHPLVSGEGRRNAYTNNLAIDHRGALHLSWCWRESSDVATNHDICYACSPDGGRRWYDSSGNARALPFLAENSERAWTIPQGSELINQTSMAADSNCRPIIATYWRKEGTRVPQFSLVFHDGTRWREVQAGKRKTPFSLSGRGTKAIPVSRPRVLVGPDDRAYVFFRDRERGNRVCVAVSGDAQRQAWHVRALTRASYAHWEPTVDERLWREQGIVNLFLQKTIQKDGEGLAGLKPQMVSVLEWNMEKITTG